MPDGTPAEPASDAQTRETSGAGARPSRWALAHDEVAGGGAGPGGAGPDGAGPDGAGPDGLAPGGAGPDGLAPGGAGPDGLAPGGAASDGAGLGGPASTGGADGGGTEGPAAETPTGERAGFRLAAFGALLIVVLFAGYGLGRLNNGVASASAPPAGTGTTGTTGAAMPGMTVNENQPHTHNMNGAATQAGGAAAMGPMGATVGGLALSSGGLTLVPVRTDFVAGKPQRLEFRIVGTGGAPVTTYAVVHDKLLHLVVIRRDLSGFQHVHPTMAADGTWGIDLTLAEPGIYRMVADFSAVVGGQQLATTLGADLTVAGDYSPRALPAPARTSRAGDFAVSYEGTPAVTSTQPILVTVTGRDGKPAALQPYLAAFGHLVVMRQGDLAYVHVHPETQLVDGKVKFWLAAPSAGTYRMFFDFQVAGQVHTAAWTSVLS